MVVTRKITSLDRSFSKDSRRGILRWKRWRSRGISIWVQKSRTTSSLSQPSTNFAASLSHPTTPTPPSLPRPASTKLSSSRTSFVEPGRDGMQRNRNSEPSSKTSWRTFDPSSSQFRTGGIRRPGDGGARRTNFRGVQGRLRLPIRRDRWIRGRRQRSGRSPPNSSPHERTPHLASDTSRLHQQKQARLDRHRSLAQTNPMSSSRVFERGARSGRVGRDLPVERRR